MSIIFQQDCFATKQMIHIHLKQRNVCRLTHVVHNDAFGDRCWRISNKKLVKHGLVLASVALCLALAFALCGIDSDFPCAAFMLGRTR